MPTYLLLVRPSTNRVYAGQAPAIATAELSTISELALDDRLGAVGVRHHAGVPYLAFTTEAPLDQGNRRLIGAASCAYVLFEEVGVEAVSAGRPLLAPVDLPDPARYPDDLLTTLKYTGKTNEQFTALLVNLALAASRRGFDALFAGERVRLLDPVCGRGTTLNQALAYGLDAVGIESQSKDLDLYLGFIRRWLQDHRLKHTSTSERRRRGPGRDRPARHTTVRIRPPWRSGKDDQVLELIDDDSARARDHLRASSVDLVVGDLPYGIQHTARSDRWGASRSAAALLAEALPAWRAVLRGGGALCLAYNTKAVSPDEVHAAVRAHGLEVVPSASDGRFAHRVDQAIHRDLVLAVKPG